MILYSLNLSMFLLKTWNIHQHFRAANENPCLDMRVMTDLRGVFSSYR